jgi:hypothetical protein
MLDGFAVIEKAPERRCGPQDAIYGWALFNDPMER